MRNKNSLRVRANTIYRGSTKKTKQPNHNAPFYKVGPTNGPRLDDLCKDRLGKTRCVLRRVGHIAKKPITNTPYCNELMLFFGPIRTNLLQLRFRMLQTTDGATAGAGQYVLDHNLDQCHRGGTRRES